MFFACLQNIYDYFAHSHRRWNLLLEKSKSTESFTSLVNEDQNVYERKLEDTNNISLHADSESEIENDDQKNENTSKMTSLKKNISNKVKHPLHLKGLCKTRWSARVKATEALLNLIWWNKILQIIDVVSRLLQSKSNDLFLVVQSFQSVVDKLSVLGTHDQYNAFVTEAKTV
ncbi:hypothetical protein QTP88_018321 [Uroleucon formosanum]